MIEGLIQNLEEEAKTNKFMVGEVHPKEIAAVKKVIQNVQKIVNEPAMGQSDLDTIHQEVVILHHVSDNLRQSRDVRCIIVPPAAVGVLEFSNHLFQTTQSM